MSLLLGVTTLSQITRCPKNECSEKVTDFEKVFAGFGLVETIINGLIMGVLISSKYSIQTRLSEYKLLDKILLTIIIVMCMISFGGSIAFIDDKSSKNNNLPIFSLIYLIFLILTILIILYLKIFKINIFYSPVK